MGNVVLQVHIEIRDVCDQYMESNVCRRLIIHLPALAVYGQTVVIFYRYMGSLVKLCVFVHAVC